MVRYSESSEMMWAARTVMEEHPDPSLNDTVWYQEPVENPKATLFDPSWHNPAEHVLSPASIPPDISNPQPKAAIHTLARHQPAQTNTPTPQKVHSVRNMTVLPKVMSNGSEVKWSQEGQTRYQTLSKLGEGGAGEVLLVRDSDIKRRVAMKIIKQGDQGMSIARFVEEVRTVGQLEHPNIVPIYDVGRNEEGHYFFTMKYVEGESLDSVIEKLKQGNRSYHKKYTFERRIQIFTTILEAVHYAHQQGFIHRDLKPENVMIGNYGEVMLMDWGIAKRLHDSSHLKPEDQRNFQTQLGAVIGTPAYMAPEQVSGNDLDERTDIYSLCVLFYEFLTLRHYLEHKSSPQEYLFGVLMEEPVDSEKITAPIQGAVPRELGYLLRKGMEKLPEQRFQSVQEMLDLLQSFQEGQIRVRCAATFLKRLCFQAAHFLDNHHSLGTLLAVIAFATMLLGVFQIGSLFGQ